MEMMGPVADTLTRMLGLAADRQRVIAANIANVNVPGYRAKDLRFDEALRQAVEVEREGIAPREDGNTVVMEIENAESRKNALVYRLSLQALAHEARMARAAITGRGA